jgi:hypothetical protein
MEVGGLVDVLKTIPVEASDAFRWLKRNLFLIIRELLLKRPGYLKSEGIYPNAVTNARERLILENAVSHGAQNHLSNA